MDKIFDSIITLVIAGVVGVGLIFIKKGCSLLAKKLDVDISEKEQGWIDAIIESAVRATEEHAKLDPLLTSEDKEDMAVNKAKAELGDKFDEQSLRDKIKAKVNKIFH